MSEVARGKRIKIMARKKKKTLTDAEIAPSPGCYCQAYSSSQAWLQRGIDQDAAMGSSPPSLIDTF
jgi:hypothetical protein